MIDVQPWRPRRRGSDGHTDELVVEILFDLRVGEGLLLIAGQGLKARKSLAGPLMWRERWAPQPDTAVAPNALKQPVQPVCPWRCWRWAIATICASQTQMQAADLAMDQPKQSAEKKPVSISAGTTWWMNLRMLNQRGKRVALAFPIVRSAASFQP
jgi:hypothetical protein